MPVVDRRFVLTKGPPWGFRVYLDNKNVLTISKVRRHSPAEVAKLRSGDQIISINGRPVAGVNHAEAMNMIDTTFGTLDVLISRFESTSTQTLIFDKVDTKIADDMKTAVNLNLQRSERSPDDIKTAVNLNLQRSERSPDEIKVPACSPETEVRTYEVKEQPKAVESLIRPSSPDVQPVPISRLMKEYDIPDNSFDQVPKKKHFADSSFYNDPYNLYPSTEEKMQMARMVASSLYAPDNKSSKGASIFERQRKRAEKYTLQKEVTQETNLNGFATTEHKYDLAHWPEVMDPKEISPSPIYRLGYSSGPPVPPPPPAPPAPNETKTIQEFMEKVQRFPKAKHNVVSPDLCFDIAAALHNSDSRGAQIFAKQKHRAQKWTVAAPETVSSQPVRAFSPGPSDNFRPPYSGDQQFKSKIVTMNRSQNQFSNIAPASTNQSPIRKPTLVIRRNSNTNTAEPLKTSNKLLLSTSSNMAAVVEPVAPPPETSTAAKWKPVKFNIPQRAS